MKRKLTKGLSSMALVLCLMVGLLCGAAFADANISCSVGQSINNVQVYSTGDTIQSCTYLGDLPAGVGLTYTANGIFVSGTPTAAGNYSIQLSIQTNTGSVTSNVNFSVGGAVQPPVQPPVQTQAPNFSQKPVITKSPTGETVEKGGSALFVARADNYQSFVWRLVSHDTTNTIPAKDAAWYFKGLQVSGADTDTLSLSNIPASMNGWAVECKFTNPAGSSYTSGAIITVKGVSGTTNDPSKTDTVTNTGNNNNKPGSTSGGTTSGGTSGNTTGGTTSGGNAADPGVDTSLSTPVIDQQPKDTLLAQGQTATLSVRATNPSTGKGILTYQWYESDSMTDDASKTKAIPGANQSSFTVPEIEGTKYYRVGVWVSKDGKKSNTAYSNWAEVTHGGEGSVGGDLLAPTTMPPSPSPNTNVTAPPTAEPSDEGGGSSALVFYIVVAGLALLAVGGILVYLAVINSRRGKARNDDSYYDDDYQYPDDDKR